MTNATVLAEVESPSEAKKDVLIVFTPSGKRGSFPTGVSVLEAARALGVDLDSVCGGRAMCGRCQVKQSIAASPNTVLNPGKTT